MAERPVLKQACQSCRLLSVCFPQELTPDEISKFNHSVEQQKTLHKGDRIYRQGEALTGFSMVRAGAVKTVKHLESGREVITGFWLPGDILGLNGYHLGRYPEDAVALDTAAVCIISLESFKHLASRLPRLYEKLACMMSEKMNVETNGHLHHNAQEKLAIFLVSIAERLGRNGNSRTDFRLPMTREEIGDHLGLATETVSRLFVKFEQMDVLKVNRRHVQIVDWEELKTMACDIALVHAL